MKLEVGMYVRTKAGMIAKITRHEHYWINKEEWNYITTDIDRNFEIESIIKTTNNIIDLIEVGDYVNGYKVIEFNKKRIALGLSDKSYSYYLIEDFEIKSIVTKEQFESMSYKIGD